MRKTLTAMTAVLAIAASPAAAWSWNSGEDVSQIASVDWIETTQDLATSGTKTATGDLTSVVGSNVLEGTGLDDVHQRASVWGVDTFQIGTVINDGSCGGPCRGISNLELTSVVGSNVLEGDFGKFGDVYQSVGVYDVWTDQIGLVEGPMAAGELTSVVGSNVAEVNPLDD